MTNAHSDRPAGARRGAAFARAAAISLAATWALHLPGRAEPAGAAAESQAEPDTVAYTQLHAFTPDEGACPNGALLEASDGRFYGMTRGGGRHGLGTLYRMSRQGHVEVLHTFGQGTAEGKTPNGSLIQVGDSLYGATQGGGEFGDGTVFRIGLDGTFTILHSFSEAVDGKWPQGPLLLASDGKLYGETEWGGPHGGGTVFRMDLQGHLSTLWDMDPDDPRDLSSPSGGLIQASYGFLVGTAIHGGHAFNGGVFVVQIDSARGILHEFDGNDGFDATSGVIQGRDLAFYGVTASDSATAGGVAFRLEVNGQYDVLRRFRSDDGGFWRPNGPLVTSGGQGAKLVGTATAGGAFDRGGIWRLSPDGRLKTLHDFGESIEGGVDGSEPNAGLVRSGRAYFGTTCGGGAADRGTVFRIGWH